MCGACSLLIASYSDLWEAADPPSPVGLLWVSGVASFQNKGGGGSREAAVFIMATVQVHRSFGIIG